MGGAIALALVTVIARFLTPVNKVPQLLYRTLMGYERFCFPDCGDDCPAECLDFWEAGVFVNAASVAVGFEPCYLCTGEGRDARCKPPDNPYACEVSDSRPTPSGSTSPAPGPRAPSSWAET